jgi:hypothetical protein
MVMKPLEQKIIDQIEKLHFEGHSSIKIGKMLNINPQTVSNRLKRKGISIAHKQKNAAQINENYFSIIDTQEKAYWLGFLFADGSVSYKTNAVELSLKLSDAEHLEKLKQELNFSNEIYKDSFRARFCVCNKKLKEDLVSLGCKPRKSLTLKFPEKLEDSYKFSFIRGYFEGDGTIKLVKTSKGYTMYASMLGTKEFLESVLSIFGYNKVPIKKDKRHLNNTYYIALNKSDSENFFNKIYNNCSIFLTRKYEKYLIAVQNRDILNY